MAETIFIEQDHEVLDGEIGAPLAVFWCEGHGHDAHAFIRAVIDHCLDWGRDIPRIDEDASPAELWQYELHRGDTIEYVRASKSEELSRYYPRRGEVRPVTLLDLDRHGRGTPRCAVRGCRKPFRIGTPVRAVSAADADDNAEPVMVEVYLCRDHLGAIPEPHYRTMFVPVGSEVRLPRPVRTCPGCEQPTDVVEGVFVDHAVCDRMELCPGSRQAPTAEAEVA